ncbi:serine hydrolase domain-containing protein [Agrococcus sp. BE272]|uniref:serine hydrolase domain-containing protein n=1 Tax=Agrococcus sp. BE272 TaxID=2817727 RepID=UPI0023AA2D33|nr:serine hydrolase domain-containing protein [Agrococcus sp. BE272]
MGELRARVAAAPSGPPDPPALSVAVMAHGRVEEAAGFGLLAADGQRQAGPESIFHAASMSKLVTALAALRLVAQGDIDLDQDIDRYATTWRLPRATSGGAVTLRMLLSHHSGIVDADGAFDVILPGSTRPSIDDVLRGRHAPSARAVRQEHEPGVRFVYSDAGYGVVERLLTDVIGAPFTALMSELVLQPLGMTRSRFGTPEELGADVADGHDSAGVVIEGRRPDYPCSAAAGLWSTPTDLCQIARELHRALRDSGALGIPGALARDMVSGQFDTGWAGLGAFLGGDPAGTRITSLGWGVGFQCMLRAYPDSGDAVVVMTNSDPGRPQDEAISGQVVEIVERLRGW